MNIEQFTEEVTKILKNEPIDGYVIAVKFKDGTYFTGITRGETPQDGISHLEILGLAEAIKTDAIHEAITSRQQAEFEAEFLKGDAFRVAEEADGQMTIDEVLSTPVQD